MAVTSAVVHWLDWGIWRNRHLATLLGMPLHKATGLRSSPTDTAYVGWGLKPSGQRARSLAARHNRACWLLEDGFLRSSGSSNTPSWSLVVDDKGIYYDASNASRLEDLISKPLTSQEQARTRLLIELWKHERLSKYNAGRDPVPSTIPAHYVLVVDQTAGDAAIAAGGARPDFFYLMLTDALQAHPDCQVVLRLHPEVVAGRKRGHFDLSALLANPRIHLVADDSHPAMWLANAIAVYTVTSQLGFEALLWSRPVHVYGMPFYAGWGLTQDCMSAPARRSPITLEQLVHAALVTYPRYVDPETGDTCEPEVLMRWLGLQRRQHQRFPPNILAHGFSNWKRGFVTEFLAGSSVKFTETIPPREPYSLPIATWGHKYSGELKRNGYDQHVLCIEDGFLRSVGLGAELVRPISWVIDPAGIYYDATRPSKLEEILQNYHFDDQLCKRAAALRARIVAAGITKYNLRRATQWQRPPKERHVVLVIGQVETDASIQYGANRIRRNIDLLQAVREIHPNSWILYKPHPDVLAGLRNQGTDEDNARDWCDEVIRDVPLEILFDHIDEIHVLTSLAGFEALLRSIPVSTWGQPFYAGWGLTKDYDLTQNVIARRTRHPSLDELVAAVLILYPTYISRRTRQYCSPERAVQELMDWRDESRSVPLLRRLLARAFRKP